MTLSFASPAFHPAPAPVGGPSCPDTGRDAQSTGSPTLTCAGIAGRLCWSSEGGAWSALFGLIWVDPANRAIDIAYRLARETVVYEYRGRHRSARENWYDYPPHAPYTDFQADVVALGHITARHLGYAASRLTSTIQMHGSQAAVYPLCREGWGCKFIGEHIFRVSLPHNGQTP